MKDILNFSSQFDVRSVVIENEIQEDDSKIDETKAASKLGEIN